MSNSRSVVSARHALTDPEWDFCKRYLAGLEAATAYRRAFLKEDADGGTYAKLDANGHGIGEPISSKEVSRRASVLLKQDYIQAYIAEIKTPAVELARGALLDRALFEGDRQAAQAVVDQDDKIGARDAYEHWAMVMCAIGTEVVIEIPEHGEVVVPMKALFPQFQDAVPPNDVVEKTIRTLEAYRDRAKFQNEVIPDDQESPA